MTKLTRAWKDPVYRAGLDAAELAALASNPAGGIELDDARLDVSAGGPETIWTCDAYSTCRTCFTCGGFPCESFIGCQPW